MKKKIIGILVIMIIMANFFFSTVAAKDSPVPAEHIAMKGLIPDQCYEIVVSSENETRVETVGPISLNLDIAKIYLIDGPLFKIWWIEQILKSKNAYLYLPLMLIKVKGLAFSVKYTKNIPQLPLFKRLSYETTIKENGNETAFTDKHTVIVTGFDGIFGFSRVKPFRLKPAQFWFTGTFENIIVLT